MSNQRPGPLPSKPSPAPGIRPTDTAQLIHRIEQLEKLIKEHLDEKNLWNQQIREWTGKPVEILLVGGGTVQGTLRWMDRYTILLECPEPCIVHKGAVATIMRSK